MTPQRKPPERKDAFYRRDPETGQYDVVFLGSVWNYGLTLLEAAQECQKLNKAAPPKYDPTAHLFDPDPKGKGAPHSNLARDCRPLRPEDIRELFEREAA